MIVSCPSDVWRIQGRKFDCTEVSLDWRQSASSDSDSRCPQAASGLTTSMPKRPISSAPVANGMMNCQTDMPAARVTTSS